MSEAKSSRNTILVAGPTGAGKSTLVMALAQRGYTVRVEAVDTELYSKFLDNPQEHCFTLQEKIISHRIQAARAELKGAPVVADRSVSEDIEVFCRMHYSLGYLNASELQNLETKFALTLNEPVADLIIYLDAEEGTLRRRLVSDHRDELIASSLAMQRDLYRRWINRRYEKRILIDTTDCGRDDLMLLAGNYIDAA